MLCDEEFAGWIAQPADRQHQRHLGPRDVFPATRYNAFEQLVQLELTHQLHRQPRTAEIKLVLDAHGCRVHFDPLRRGRVVFPKLQLAFAGLLVAPCRAFHTQPPGFVELAQVGHGALPRSAIGADRFDQRPIGVLFAVLLAVAGANEHARILPAEPACSTPKVFTTTRFAIYRVQNSLLGVNPGKLHPSCAPVPSQNIFRKTDFREGLAKLG